MHCVAEQFDSHLSLMDYVLCFDNCECVYIIVAIPWCILEAPWLGCE